MSFLKNKKIGIVGLGYIGKNILNYLNSLGVNVICITKNNLDVIEQESFDYLINSAGNSGDFRNDFFKTIESNIGLNSYILKNSKIKHSYVYLSSTRLYGYSKDESIIFNESDLICWQ